MTESKIIKESLSIPIHETFQQTIQGEGYWTGTPCDFIRLAGCPVGCAWCDTGYSGLRTSQPEIRGRVSIDNLIKELRSKFVVISGGEPFIHNMLPMLVERLINAGVKISIETSGSYYQPVQGAWITLSPKEHINPNFPVLEKLWGMANEIKIVISDGSEVEFYRDKLNGLEIPIHLQPEWDSFDKTLPLTLELIKKYQYRLSLQTHKLIGVK